MKNIDIYKIIQDESVLKIIATGDEKGNIHQYQPKALFTDGSTIVLLEPFEKSFSNRNLVKTIWRNGTFSLLLLGKGVEISVELRPYKAEVAGHVFREHYQTAIKKYGFDDLATAWILEVVKIKDESYEAQKEQQAKEHPYFTHLDRLVKQTIN